MSQPCAHEAWSQRPAARHLLGSGAQHENTSTRLRRVPLAGYCTSRDRLHAVWTGCSAGGCSIAVALAIACCQGGRGAVGGSEQRPGGRQGQGVLAARHCRAHQGAGRLRRGRGFRLACDAAAAAPEHHKAHQRRHWDEAPRRAPEASQLKGRVAITCEGRGGFGVAAARLPSGDNGTPHLCRSTAPRAKRACRLWWRCWHS